MFGMHQGTKQKSLSSWSLDNEDEEEEEEDTKMMIQRRFPAHWQLKVYWGK